MQKINCPLCNVDRSEPVAQVRDRLLGIGGEFTLVKCTGCGLLYLNPQPTSEEIARYYPPEYDGYVGVDLDQMSWLRRLSVKYGLYKRRRAVTR
jgi:hypothetical protein